MASASGRPSLLARFLDSFLQEKNIKWMLGVGMLILLGSSLLPVTMHWGELPPFWKNCVFLTYTTFVFGAGQWTYHRLALRRTGTVLQGLTVLLVPILFLVLHWVPHDSFGLTGLHLLLVAGTLVFSTVAARQIFNHFLRGSQPTFLISYLLLSVAGAALPGLPAAWSPLVSLLLWAIFAVGTVKVNRHVFWLTEEHRKPRIWGFFPIALLGAQFLTLFILHGVPYLPLQWLGLACVLVAIPVLLTSDAVARVFQQRTGDLVRPLPWSIVVPLVVGLVLIAAGMVLAGTGLTPPFRPQALVVTSALAAALLGVVAHRTHKQAFAWAMLGAVVLAYNFAPIFFIDLVRSLLQQGAELVQEKKLPFAFYGLTYLPLIAASMVAAWRVKAAHFAQPLRWFSIGLSVLLLTVSLGHFKAILPVSLAMLVVFVLQTLLFRDWRPAIAAIAAWTVAAFGFSPFLQQMLGILLPIDSFLCLTLAAATLLLISFKADPVLANLSPPASDWFRNVQQSLCQTGSLAITLGVALQWLIHGFVFLSTSAIWSGLAIGLLLFMLALRREKSWLGMIAMLFIHALIAQQALAWNLPLNALLSLTTLALLSQWLLTYTLARHLDARLSCTFAAANYELATCGLMAVWFGLCLPLFVLDLARPFLSRPFIALLMRLLTVAWPCTALMVGWAFDSARRQRSLMLATFAAVGIFLFTGSTWIHFVGDHAWQWTPAIWAATALLCLPATQILYRRWQSRQPNDTDHADWVIERPLTYVTLAVLCLVEMASLIYFSSPMRVAGVLALIGLVGFSLLRRQTDVRVPALIVVNWQVLCLTVQLAVPEMATIFDLQFASILPLCLPIAFASAASLLVWRFIASRENVLAIIHRTLLQCLVLFMLVHSFELSRLTPMEAVCAAGAFLLLAASELLAGCWQRLEVRVWFAEAIIAAGIAYLLYFRVLHVQEGIGMFVLLGVALFCWIIKEIAAGSPSFDALTRPLHFTAFVLPMLAVVVGVFRHISAAPLWLGANSLALLLAAGFYFWRALEERQKALGIAAGVILNVALVLLWRELVWSDPQFFMIPIGISILALVQLLHSEIPAKLHDPLRYLGALVILVSPTFHIVSGSWLHLFCLMIASVCVVLLAIGLRVRALMYTGTAFLLADLAAMVVTGSMADANVLWIAGLVLGGGVITLAAYCERHREVLVQRMYLLSDTLRTWE